MFSLFIRKSKHTFPTMTDLFRNKLKNKKVIGRQ